MAENASTELKMFVFFCLLLVQFSVSEIIFEERFEGILFILCSFVAKISVKLVKFG
jgi:hypothetical protein